MFGCSFVRLFVCSSVRLRQLTEFTRSGEWLIKEGQIQSREQMSKKKNELYTEIFFAIDCQHGTEFCFMFPESVECGPLCNLMTIDQIMS